MEGAKAYLQRENVSFTADVFPDLEMKDLPTTYVEILAERIERNHLAVDNVDEDGNSLFTAVTKVLKKKKKDYHLMLRKEVVYEMENNRERYLEFASIVDTFVALPDSFDFYLKNMSKDGTPGDLLCVLAVANLHRVRVIMMTDLKLEMTLEITPSNKIYGKDVYLSYQAESRVQFNALFHPNDGMEGVKLRDLPVTNCGILAERLDRQNLVSKISKGDGNCMFRSVSKVLKKKQKLHMEMRKALVDEMERNKAVYIAYASKFNPEISAAFDAYIEDMSKEGTWGDFICLLAAANLFHVRFTVITNVYLYMAMEIAPTDYRSKKDVFLGNMYVGLSGHSNAVFPRNEVPAVDRNSPSPSDERALVRWYKVRVENIPESMTTGALMREVSAYGDVFDATLDDTLTGRVGIVIMCNKESMENVIANLNGQVWEEGLEIKVEEENEELYCPYDWFESNLT